LCFCGGAGADASSQEFRRELQRRLQGASVYDGKIDGKFGEDTKMAVEALAKQPQLLHPLLASSLTATEIAA